MARGRPDFSPTAVDVVLRPEWAAKEGVDKNFSWYGVGLASGLSTTGEYAVPTGKTLYIISTTLGAMLASTGVGNPQVMAMFGAGTWYGPPINAWILDDPDCILGGNGGNAQTFPKPLVYEAGDHFMYAIFNYSGLTLTLGHSIQGYEV